MNCGSARGLARIASCLAVLLLGCDEQDDRTCAQWLACYDACRYSGQDANHCAYVACEPPASPGLVYPVYDADAWLEQAIGSDCATVAEAFTAAYDARSVCYLGSG